MRERRERRCDAPGLHLPHVLPLEIDAATLVGTELRHREPALAPHRAQTLAGALQEQRLAGDVGIDAGRHQSPRAMKSMMARVASVPYGAANMPRECSPPPNISRVFGIDARSKQRSTFGAALSPLAHTKSFRPLMRRESSSGTATTGAEIETMHSMSASKLDARIAWPPMDAP